MKAVTLILFYTILHLLALALFSNGFLLTRITLDDRTPRSKTTSSATFEKVVILVIDALRYDFTVPQNRIARYLNHFTVLSKYAQESPRNSFLAKFVADPPTTTLQRLKGLTTGSLPTFVDAGSNFAGETINEDNLLSQLRTAGKRIAFAGDDTWQALFPGTFEEQLNFPFESLNVWDLDTVDRGVHYHLFEAEDALLNSTAKEDWDVLIAHTLGLDHAGHRYGPNHAETTRKLLEMNKWVQELIDHIDDQTLLVVFGDHGMNAQGDHGGDSPDEVDAALFMYSKKERFSAPCASSVISKTVAQIDLVPTLALLSGIPIPFSSLGSPIQRAFSANSMVSFDQAAIATTMQIKSYIKSYEQHSSSIQQALKKVEHSSSAISQSTLEWQRHVLSVFRQQWAQYHLPSILCGLMLMAFAIILSALSLSFGQSRSITRFFGVITSLQPLWMFYSLRFHVSTHIACLGAATSPLLMFLLLHTSDGMEPKSPIPYNSGFLIGLASSILLLHAGVFASNSFTVHEDRISLFLLTILLLCAFFHVVVTPMPKFAKYKRASLLAAVAALSRLAASIRLCREEQSDACTSNFYGVAVWVATLMCVALSFIWTSVVVNALRAGANFTKATSRWVYAASLLLLNLSSLYWLLDAIDADNAKLRTARILCAIFLGLLLGWYNLPLPLTFRLQKDELLAEGVENLTAATLLQLILPLLSLLIFLSRSTGSVSLLIMVLQIAMLTAVLMTDQRMRGSTFYSVMLFLELAYLHFFASGHQMSLPFIQWDLAFLVSRKILYPISPLFIIGNAFASFLIGNLCLPVTTLWSIPRTSSRGRLRQEDHISRRPSPNKGDMKPMMLGTILAHSVITFSTMLFATHFRRHLMVWKIFAPRYMCASLIMLLVDVTLLLGTAFLICIEHKKSSLTTSFVKLAETKFVK